MADTNPSKPQTTNRIKLVMIAALTGVLLCVIVFQSSDQPITPQSVRTAEARPAALATIHSNERTPHTTVTWPTTPISEVLASNPFRLPEALKGPGPKTTLGQEIMSSVGDLATLEESRTKDMQDALKGHKLKAIIQTPKGIGAIIGDNAVGVGDLVGDRLRIKEIQPKGVVFELVEQPNIDLPKKTTRDPMSSLSIQ